MAAGGLIFFVVLPWEALKYYRNGLDRMVFLYSLFFRWLQEVFDAPLIIQIADDEGYFCNDLSLEKVKEMAVENIKDIIAMDFHQDKTFIFRNLEYMG